MSTFSIGTSPQAVAQGFQREVTLYNQGPDTVYVDNNTSVSDVTGYVIRPGDSMSWQPDEPLYAVCRLLLQKDGLFQPGTNSQSGTTRLQVTDSGTIQIPEASRTTTLYNWAALSVASQNRWASDINVSAYKSLSIVFNDSLPLVMADKLSRMNILVKWHAEDGTHLQNALYSGRISTQNRLVIPVRGAYASFRFNANKGVSGVPVIIPATSIIGHTSEVAEGWTITPVYETAAPFFNTANPIWGDNDNVSFTALGVAAATTVRFFIPAKTRRIKFRLGFDVSVAASTSWGFASMGMDSVSNGTDFLFDEVNKTAAGTNFIGELAIPWQTTPLLRLTGAFPAGPFIDNLQVAYIN